MSLQDAVSLAVIGTNIFVMLIAWRNARRFRDIRRTMLLSIAAVMFGSAVIYSSLESGIVPLQALIDVPVLRINLLILDVLAGAWVVYVSRSRP